jgi:hypothetical protein
MGRRQQFIVFTVVALSIVLYLALLEFGSSPPIAPAPAASVPAER